MVTLNTTPNRGYEEPHIDNGLSVDIGRLVAALRAIDTDMATAFFAIAAKAGLNSPAFTGVPTVPTAAPGTDTGQAASTAFVRAAVAALVDSSPGALDTLNELAAALGDDPNFSTTVLAAIGLKADAAATTGALALKADAADVTTLQTQTNINGLTAKTTPVDADVMRIADSAASFGYKKLTFANLKAWIRSFVGVTLHSTVATTSGTTIEFNSIPAGVRRIKVKQRNLRLSGTSQALIQLGTASSYETTGYLSGITVARDGSTTVGYNSSAGIISTVGATSTVGTTADVVIERLDGNEWTASLSGSVNNNGSAISQGVSGGGEKTLSGELTRLRLNTVNGTDTFSAGKATVLYEF